MKRFIAILIMLIVLSGCGTGDSSLQPALQVRDKLLTGNGCTFDAVVTSDYDQYFYTFEMLCSVSPKGELEFTVTKPDTIEGITGIISGNGGKLTIDDNTTPVMAPWIFINSLRSGYIQCVTRTDEYDIVTVNESYEDDALELEIWLTKDGLPKRGDILYRGKRFLVVEVANFRYL